MTADLQELFDRAGRNPPAAKLDPDAVLLQARRSRNRRITAAVVAAGIVAVALVAGVASQWRLPATPLPATHPTASTGHLAFEVDGDIYLAGGDGRNPVRIADGSPEDGPACGGFGGEGSLWSPDGRHLAFRGSVARGGGGCQGTVSISDPTGRVVASFPGEGWLISWSPDSTRIASWVVWGQTIGIYGLDGARQALLRLPAGLMAPGDFDPVWSPDGATLQVPLGVEIPVDGSTPRLLPADDPRSQWNVRYSPDGARVAYLSRDGNASLDVAAADGSHARVVIARGVENAVWSPAGDRIAFNSVTGNATTAMGPSTELKVVDVDSGAVTTLAGTGGVDALSVLEFSPDGDQILFSRTDAHDVSSLWSVRVDGSDAHLLIAGAIRGDWQALRPAT